jgi:hypothetical protein
MKNYSEKHSISYLSIIIYINLVKNFILEKSKKVPPPGFEPSPSPPVESKNRPCSSCGVAPILRTANDKLAVGKTRQNLFKETKINKNG